METTEKLRFCLQYFAESGTSAGAAGDGAAAENGVNEADIAGSARNGDYGDLFLSSDEVEENNGIVDSEEASFSSQEREETFDDLIGKNGRFREEYEKRTQKLIQDRLKSSKGAEQKLSQVQKALDLLSVRYGVDKNDISAITDAVLGDNDLLESKANEMGMDLSAYREFIKTQAENERLHNEIKSFNLQEQSKQIQNRWVGEAKQMQEKYPNFDLQNEIDTNAEFADLLTKGLGVEKAYSITHLDEILSSVKNQTASAAKQATINDIRAKGLRPRENSGNGVSSLKIAKSVNDLTDEDLDKIRELTRKGVEITL